MIKVMKYTRSVILVDPKTIKSLKRDLRSEVFPSPPGYGRKLSKNYKANDL
jgi:hypothetical protein